MKELFSNNIGKKLIENKGFIIVDTSAISALIMKYTLVKEKQGTLYLLNFADADILNFNNSEGIKENCHNEMSVFKVNTRANSIVYYKVFVSSSGLLPEVVSNILSYYKRSIIEKCTFVPVIVDLATNKITSGGDESIDRVGVLSTLYEGIDEKDNYTNLNDLEAVLKGVESENAYTSLEHKETSYKPYVTYFIMAINIIVFILMTMSGGTENLDVLTKFGAKVNSKIIQGEYWRLLTCAFIHIGIPHIVFNMYGLFNLGTIVEKIFGSKKYIFIYLCSALLGSIGSFIFSPAISAGASGAIFGLFGALLYLGQKNPKMFTTSFGINVLIVIGFNLIYGFSNSGIDNFAHIGGLIGGYISANIVGLKN